MELKPQFEIGDVVYKAGLTTERKQHDCPDCLGSKKWSATSPAGQIYSFTCPRCTDKYTSNRDLSLKYTVYTPSVQKLTIGSVRLNTLDDEPFSYMCVETGVGSGTVHKESDLFVNENTAFLTAQDKATQQTLSTEWMSEQYNATLELSDYQLDNACIESAEKLRSALRIKYGWLISDLECCFSMDDVSNIVEKLKKFEDIE